MSVLEHFAQDRLVLVVDHASEFKASFKKVMTIKCTEGRSTVV